MMDVFLGYPSKHVHDWLTDNGSEPNPPPPVEVETWVPASNPDGSPLSDAEHAEWVFNDGQEHTVTWGTDVFGQDGFILDGEIASAAYVADQYQQVANAYDTCIFWSWCNDKMAYRKYTPGHWEDADGNWINGYWEREDNDEPYDTYNLGWKNASTNDWCCSIVFAEPGHFWAELPEGLEPIQWTADVGQGGDVPINAPVTDINASLLVFKYQSTILYRTWNNTKPAPAAL